MFRGAEQSGELLCTNRPSKDRIYRVSHHKGLLRSDISDGFTRLRCEKFTVLLCFISNVDLPLNEGLIGYFPSRFRSTPVLYAHYNHLYATTHLPGPSIPQRYDMFGCIAKSDSPIVWVRIRTSHDPRASVRVTCLSPSKTACQHPLVLAMSTVFHHHTKLIHLDLHQDCATSTQCVPPARKGLWRFLSRSVRITYEMRCASLIQSP